jgi:cytochrome c oxidase assembly protein subunit 15
MSKKTSRSLRIWLYSVAALIALMVMVGGATRLTESGLSITEWKPVAGTLPPLGSAQWSAEFEKYRATTQYKELNRGMMLPDFKKIYWWEWAHRFLGRLIGAAFALPFLFFAVSKNLPRALVLKLGGILALGGLQGVVGWWMVASGLSDRINVAPYRLAIHLTLALAIFAAILRVAFSLKQSSCSDLIRASQNKKGDPRVEPEDDGRSWKVVLLSLLFLQIFLGGLVAGNRAGYVYNTWPLMDGGLAPSGLFIMQPWWRNFFENLGLVQFLHRMTAYALLLFGLALFLKMRSREAAWLLAALVLQAGLGIATLLSQMNFALALAHQAGIVIILAILTTDFKLFRLTGLDEHG